MIFWAEYLKLFVALLAITDILGNVPIFLQQTTDMSQAARRVTALSAGVATGLILMLFAFYGELVLESFGITIEAFKIVGGIVILLIALQMLGLLADTTTSTGASHMHPIAIGIFPMAVPLFAGPGTISTVMVYAHKDLHSSHDLIIMLLILSIVVAIIFGLSAAALMARYIGAVGQQVVNRLLGMIVGALGIEFILEGVEGYFSL